MQPLGRKHTVASDVDRPYGEAGEEGRPVVVNVKVKELEVEDRPREKAMAHGIGSLSTADLFAVILRTGQQGYPITQLCRELMKANDNSLFNLERRTRDELLEIDGIGYFPDAPTERGIKHLQELAKAVDKGYHTILAFVIQMNGITEVRPNMKTHPAFGEALEEAKKAGVEVLFLPCHVTENTLEFKY